MDKYFVVAKNQSEFEESLWAEGAMYGGKPEDDVKYRSEFGRFKGMEAHYTIESSRDCNTDVCIIVLDDREPDTRTLKEKVLDLCEKYNVKYDKVRYYKESPYQKHRFTKKYVGEEVWLKVEGFNHCINSMNDSDITGDIEPFFRCLFADPVLIFGSGFQKISVQQFKQMAWGK